MTKNTMEFGTERDDPFFDEEWIGMKRGDWKKRNDLAEGPIVLERNGTI